MKTKNDLIWNACNMERESNTTEILHFYVATPSRKFAIMTRIFFLFPLFFVID